MDPRFQPQPPRPTARPRRVVNGIKVRAKAGPDLSSWAAQRWMRIAEANAPGDQLAEGIQYARAGQTRTMNVAAGAVTAKVQGRMPDAYPVAVRLPTFTREQWEGVLAAMTAQARYTATLLAGALPANIEDVFAPLGLRLFPVESSDLAVSCTCDVSRGVISFPPPNLGLPGGPTALPTAPPEAAESLAGSAAGSVTEPGAEPAPSVPVTIAGVTPGKPQPWCKHVCCIMALLADRLSIDPFLIFTLRGMPGAEVLERLAQLRAAAAATKSTVAASPIYLPHVPELSEVRPPPLAEVPPDRFFSSPAGLEGLSMPIEPPEVSHPLLRRLGATPFEGAKFPLVGLLSTCYSVISEAAIRGEMPPPPPPGEGEPEPDEA